MAHTIQTILAALTACLCEGLEERGRPTCFCGMIPTDPLGTLDVLGCNDSDDCDGNGSAYVRLVRTFNSTTLPEIDLSGNCTKRAIELEVGIMRCIPFITENGSQPTVEEHAASTELILSDMEAMRSIISCCLADMKLKYVLGEYAVFPSELGFGGGYWQVFSRVS